MKILGRFWPYINLKEILYRKVKSPIKHYSIPPPEKEKTTTKAIQDIRREENQVQFTRENPYILDRTTKTLIFYTRAGDICPIFDKYLK